LCGKFFSRPSHDPAEFYILARRALINGLGDYNLLRWIREYAVHPPGTEPPTDRTVNLFALLRTIEKIYYGL